MTFLRNTYPATIAGHAMPTCLFELKSSGELAGPVDDTTRISLCLYRVTVNEHCRQTHPPGSSRESPIPLGLDLHYMLTAWAGNAQDEQLPLAWVMRQLYQYPILDASSLSPEAGWSTDEVIQIIPAELATEDMMRIWDALEHPYRVSVSYIARLVRIDDVEAQEEALPVVATRFAFGTAAVAVPAP